MMQPERETSTLLAELDRLSGNRLRRRADLGMLLQLGRTGDTNTLDDLAFSAKFLARARVMMERVGPDGEGYERLAEEFARHLEKGHGLLRSLLNGAPEESRRAFAGTYLAPDPSSLSAFLDLCSDLAWYKNWLIDNE